MESFPDDFNYENTVQKRCINEDELQETLLAELRKEFYEQVHHGIQHSFTCAQIIFPKNLTLKSKTRLIEEIGSRFPLLILIQERNGTLCNITYVAGSNQDFTSIVSLSVDLK